MSLLRNVPLKFKLLAVILATSAASLLAACAVLAWNERSSLREGMVRDRVVKAEVLAAQSTAALSFRDPRAAAEILRKLAGERRILAAVLYGTNGTVFARYLPAGGGTGTNGIPASVPALTAPAHAFRETSLDVFVPVQLSGRRLGTVFLRSDLTELDDRTWEYARTVAVVLAGALAFAALLSLQLQKIVSRPILALARTTRTVSASRDYSLRAEQTGNDELGDLINGFNDMLGQVQKRDAELEEARQHLERRVEDRTREIRDQIAVRERAEREVQQQLVRMRLVNQITHAIAERRDLHSIFEEVLAQLEIHLPADFGAVYLYGPEDRSLRLAATCRRSAPTQAPLAPLEGEEVGLDESGVAAAAGGEVLYEPSVATSEAALFRGLAAWQLGSGVIVPMMADARLLGLLLVARRGDNAFSVGECEFLRRLCEHVALAAHQARLHTQLQSAYDELRQTQQAVMQHERLRALGQMASGIAHDINNALSPVSGFAELLLRHEPHLSDQGRRHVQNIKTASDDIAHIVTHMRDFYRKRDENQPLLPVSLNQVARQVIELTRPRWRDLAQQRGLSIDVRTDLDESLPEVIGTASELREALTNLLFNAIDAMPDGGTITLRTRRASLAGPDSASPGRVAIEVSDTGTGMDAETRARCLEPFFSTKGQLGTGLGLAMVYGVAQRHEATIEIDSEPGLGSTFRLVFPEPETTRIEIRAGVTSPEVPVRPRRILFVDDEPLLRELMKEVLECEGHEVTMADGGRAGIGAFRDAAVGGRPFEVVITDLGMPEVDGRQLAAMVKRESPRTPVIMMTGWGTLLKESDDRPGQVDAMLNKPPQIAELNDVLRKLDAQDAS